MEPTIWGAFTRFVKESYTKRIKVAGSGIFMGLITSNNLLFAGELANMVGPFWWVVKGIGTVVLAFSTSLATSYASMLIEQYKEKKSQNRIDKKRKDRAA